MASCKLIIEDEVNIKIEGLRCRRTKEACANALEV